MQKGDSRSLKQKSFARVWPNLIREIFYQRTKSHSGLIRDEAHFASIRLKLIHEVFDQRSFASTQG